MSKTLVVNYAFGPYYCLYPGDMMSKVAGPSFSLAKFGLMISHVPSNWHIVHSDVGPGFEVIEAAELAAVAFADVVVYQRVNPWVNVV